MPHYYFDIKDGHRLVDQSGSNFKDDDDAVAKAEVIAIEVSLDEIQYEGEHDGKDDRACNVERRKGTQREQTTEKECPRFCQGGT